MKAEHTVDTLAFLLGILTAAAIFTASASITCNGCIELIRYKQIDTFTCDPLIRMSVRP